MILKLIAPRREGREFWDLKTAARLTGKKYGGNILLSLPTIAALTPSDIDVIIEDENVNSLDFDEKVDMVGISFFTPYAKRAYQIADRFKERNVKVILGGIHASMMPNEAIQHANTVVIGEAENVWSKVIHDACTNNLQKFYQVADRPNLADSPVPAWEKVRTSDYNINAVQTSRGCPFNCRFCSVKSFLGQVYRYKPIENILKEIEMLRRLDEKKSFFFTDDNIAANPKRAKELFRALMPLELRYWWCQAPIIIAKDNELLDLIYDSGCRQIFIGFESISPKAIAGYNKSNVNSVEDYLESIDIIHQHGIAVFGSFVFGSDYDDDIIFERTAAFIKKANIGFAQLNILTPLPGTELYADLESEGRILHKDWERYNVNEVCFQPKLMSPETLQKGFHWALQEVYKFDQLGDRLTRLWGQKVLVRSRDQNAKMFTRGRVLLTVRGIFLLKFKFGAIIFLLKSLWKRNVTSITAVLLALNFHDYAFHFPKADKQSFSRAQSSK